MFEKQSIDLRTLVTKIIDRHRQLMSMHNNCNASGNVIEMSHDPLTEFPFKVCTGCGYLNGSCCCNAQPINFGCGVSGEIYNDQFGINSLIPTWSLTHQPMPSDPNQSVNPLFHFGMDRDFVDVNNYWSMSEKSV